ncbi:hypothetical protein FRC02_005434 [Tulasnella sp. 418]|nr:hypothetical protein FRC02_005434 [Tulasnella sp. 418]
MTQHPLSGITVVEFAGLAPGPFAGLVLADWGATVIRIDRKDQRFSTDVLSRGKFSLAIDPKVPAGLDTLKRLLTKADVLIDPFRPGTMERLGLGPQVFLGNPGSHESGINHRLIYARICGFSPSGLYPSSAFGYLR